MERMWAPWRIGYILGEKPEGCILCAKVEAPPDEDEENLVLFRGRRCSVLLNLYPYSNGHLMVVPKAHIGELEALDEPTLVELCRLSQWSVSLLKKAISPGGFNLGINLGRIAGACIFDHLHFHVVPRWPNDTNFMTAVAGIRLIPQALEETYGVLRQAMAEVPPPQDIEL